MTFEVFNKLACNNRMVLLMAIDLLMQNGRTFLQNTEITVLVTALKTDTKNFLRSICWRKLKYRQGAGPSEDVPGAGLRQTQRT